MDQDHTDYSMRKEHTDSNFHGSSNKNLLVYIPSYFPQLAPPLLPAQPLVDTKLLVDIPLWELHSLSELTHKLVDSSSSMDKLPYNKIIFLKLKIPVCFS